MRYETSRRPQTAIDRRQDRSFESGGIGLMVESNETRLLHFIVQTACKLTGAAFAALSLRPLNKEGQPLMPSEGKRFHLAAAVGVTPEQEVFFRHMSLGGEGLLAPLFHQGVPVLITDVLALHSLSRRSAPSDLRHAAREAAEAYALGEIPTESLRAPGIPPGHPSVRSFLGVPVLDSQGEVRGGLLLGHSEPGRFTAEDEGVLAELAAQAAVVLENAELDRAAQRRSQVMERIFATLGDGILLVDEQGSILYENAAAQQMRELLEGTPGEKQAIEALLHVPAQHALSEEVKDVLVALVDKHGEAREYSVSSSLLPLPVVPTGPLAHDLEMARSVNGRTGILLIWHDVTERRLEHVERAARAQMEDRLATLQLILDELPSGVFLVYGYDARLVLINRSALAVLGAYWPPGQPMEEFLNQNGVGIFDINGHPVPFEQLAAIRAVRRGETVPQFQSITRQPNGTVLSTLVSAVALDAHRLKLPLLQKGEAPAEEPARIGLLAFQDVTSFKDAERLKDEFIGIAAHELRNPLTVLSGYVQMLLLQTRRGKGPKLLPTQEEALQSIDRSTTELVELTEDLLDVTRLQGGGWQLHSEPTDLVALVQRTVERLQKTTGKHTLSIVTTLPSLVVYADPGRIEQVLSNLISNAIKYSPNGGPIEITLWEARDAQEARLSVRDYGIGIPEKDQARIFGHFARASNADTYKISGTGFGLYLCRELIARLDGRIWFESKEEQGSTFFMALPHTS